MSSDITLRFKYHNGIIRVSCNPKETCDAFFKRVAEKTEIPFDLMAISNSPSLTGERITNFANNKSIESLGFKHGDMLHLSRILTREEKGKAREEPYDQKSQETELSPILETINVDAFLDKIDGKLVRGYTSLCRHAIGQMCHECMPLDPYDTLINREKGIKYLSFHAYIEREKVRQSKDIVHILEEPKFSVDKSCRNGHKAWPEGICSKCQPSAISLKTQQFRMVDHVEFSSSAIVNRFLDAWRSSGKQRFGYMYGRYMPYNSHVPLGIKAVVEAIYEPPQSDEPDGIEIHFKEWEDHQKPSIDRIMRLCGLQPVGLIFTDLTDDGSGNGTVLCKRHINSFFLSGIEVVFAANHQLKYPYETDLAFSKRFGSRFVTAVISGNSEGAIEIDAFQVSNDACSMVEADLIEPSIHPARIVVKDQDSTRYVPEVFYTDLNEYNRPVTMKADPAFPVEYSLVTLTHGFPDQPEPLLKGGFSDKEFPIANRKSSSNDERQKTQMVMQLSEDLSYSLQTGNAELLMKYADFHFLAFLACFNMLSLGTQHMLLKAVLKQDLESVQSLVVTEDWLGFIDTMSMMV